MNRARTVIVLVLLVAMAVTLASAFLTRGVMTYLPFLQARKGNWTGAYVPHGVVDQRPWQTAATLAALAQSAEEKEFAREAERLADHEVDQAFSQSLRQASLDEPNLSGKALALQQRVIELQKTIKNDQARIASLNVDAGTKPASAVSNGSDLEIAKAQLGLDQNELADSIEDLARESGDQRVKLQQELAARQAAMKQYRDRASMDDGQTAVASAEQYKTFAQQLGYADGRPRRRFHLSPSCQTTVTCFIVRQTSGPGSLFKFAETVVFKVWICARAGSDHICSFRSPGTNPRTSIRGISQFPSSEMTT